MPTQKCPRCDQRVTYELAMAVGTHVQCAGGHDSVLARCPNGQCGTKRIALRPDIAKGTRGKHGACLMDYEVVTAGTPAILKQV